MTYRINDRTRDDNLKQNKSVSEKKWTFLFKCRKSYKHVYSPMRKSEYTEHTYTGVFTCKYKIYAYIRHRNRRRTLWGL